MMIRSFSVVFVLATLLSFSSQPPDVNGAIETIEFTGRPMEVGDRRTDRGGTTMNATIEVSLGDQVIQSVDQMEIEEEEVRRAILAMDGDQVTKIELHCVKKVKAESGPAGESKTVSPIDGKTLFAVWNGGDIEVLDASGNPVDADEKEEALDVCRATFDNNVSEFASILPDRPVEVGETIEVDPDVARGVFSGADPTLEVAQAARTPRIRRQ